MPIVGRSKTGAIFSRPLNSHASCGQTHTRCFRVLPRVLPRVSRNRTVRATYAVAHSITLARYLTSDVSHWIDLFASFFFSSTWKPRDLLYPWNFTFSPTKRRPNDGGVCTCHVLIRVESIRRSFFNRHFRTKLNKITVHIDVSWILERFTRDGSSRDQIYSFTKFTLLHSMPKSHSHTHYIYTYIHVHIYIFFFLPYSLSALNRVTG